MKADTSIDIRPNFKISENLSILPFKDSSRNPLKLTNPSSFAILVWAKHEDTMIYSFFPDIDPKNPSSHPTSLAVAPQTVTFKRLLQIFNDFNEIKPDNVVNVSLVHLSEEQLSVLALVDFDQNSLFNLIYQDGQSDDKLFEIVALAKLVEDNQDEICT